MSHSIEEVYAVYSETTRRARKAHACGACDTIIAAGERYVHVGIVNGDGTAETVKRCARCQKIHLHLRSIDPGELWPDEHLSCGEDYKEHWQVDPPEEIAALAFALPGETAVAP